MKHGHTTGQKHQPTAHRATRAKYAAMGAAIAKKLEGKTVEELLNWKVK